MQQTDEFCSIDSEAGILATLVRNPLFYYYAEDLLPNHFFDRDNRYLYTAISDLIRRGIQKIDPYNIIEDLNASEATRGYTENLTVERLNEFFDTADTISRSTVKEYKLLVGNVLATAFRRDIRQRLKDCMGLCERIDDREKLERKIYDKIDGVMLEYSAHDEIPAYRDVVDECWNEIRARQVDGFSGIPFKFPTLNQYAVIERGELFIFAAEAKQGKSMILLNCAMDLLRQGLSVLYLDSELNTRLFTARVLSHLSAVEFRRLTAGNYTPEEADRIQEAIDWIKTKSFTHVYIPTFDLQSIYTTVKRVYHTQGIDVLIVDYFKSSGDGDAFDSYQELGKFVDTVKNKICGDLNICGIGAAQATASGKVADSAKIGRNASTIAVIQDKTPEEIEADGPECGNKKLRVVLNRNGMQHAPGEYIDLRFNGDMISYEEARQHIPVQPY